MVDSSSFQFMRLTLIYFEREDELVLYLFINIYIYIYLYLKSVLFLLGKGSMAEDCKGGGSGTGFEAVFCII